MKITDFGLAKKLDSTDGMTQTQSVMGTPSYMAPEQAAGQTKHAGPACDIWSLGVILYEMITGSLPFVGASSFEVISQVMQAEPTAPEAKLKVPKDLETICLKCLRKEPKDRYANARALADDLGAFRNGTSISARPMGGVEKGVRWMRRNPSRLAAALLAGVSLALAAVLLRSAVGTGPVSGEAVAARSRPGRYVLVVGVNEYEKLADGVEKVPNLQEADRDALKLGATFLDVGYDRGELLIMSTNETAGSDLYPVSEKVRRQMRLLCARLRDGDSVMVVFSGYEMQFAGSDEYFLCTADSERADLRTMLSLSEICNALAESKATSKGVVIDSCRSREAGEGGALRPKAPPAGVCVLFASSAGEAAFEGRGNLKSGVLSHFFREGIRGGAGANRDGSATWSQVVRYVCEQVPAYVNSEFHGRTQRPQSMGETPDFEVGRLK